MMNAKRRERSVINKMQSEKVDIKKRFFVIGILAALGLIFLIIYLLVLFPTVDWLFIIGTMLIVSGVALISSLFTLRNNILKNRKYLFFAIVFNPGLVQIFTGISMLTLKYSTLNFIFIMSGAGMIISFIIGLLMLIKNVKGNKESEIRL